jgi:uncharacterized circularly permuted ATP-grasp superfamily protein/uncharacterized alpha-E superfamily protein
MSGLNPATLDGAAPEVQPAGLFQEYSPLPHVYDEMLEAAGSPRSHWLPLICALGRLGREELLSRSETARRFLRENGVTYNVYGDAQGVERTWELDPLPLLISPSEWSQLEAGLIQRTHLLSLVLGDLYDGQRLLHEQRLPPPLVFANPSFLRPCCGIQPLRNIRLFLHAVDLTRGPDGQWWVLADRTQAPSGAGYAVVNRIALSRVFPEEFRECRVQRLASFFQVARDTLRSLAPVNRDNPNVVLLTPGAYNETYFEHAYLARYLGLPLVEGGDLTVRERRVYIKTLEGLRPVDVILRRVDDVYCDPLELSEGSVLGVPGLVEAARAGQVAVANPLGSGLVETPALLAFLPVLCRHLLGEELKLPSVATWWCGHTRERQYVAEHLPELVIKRAFPSASNEPFFGRALDAEQREALLAELHAWPQGFVGQQQLALSTAPTWGQDRLRPRSLVLRVFVCATGDGYRVMPGGLTRVSLTEGGQVVSTQSGGSSKDTWVLSDGPVSTLTLLKPPAPVVRIERRASEVPSRIADNLFWLGRYTERLEDTIRLLRVAISRLAGESVAEAPPELTALMQMLALLELVPASAAEQISIPKVEKHLLLLIYQANRIGSVREVLNRLRHNAFVVRDRFTADTWRIFNRLQMDARVRPGRIPVTESLALLNTLILDLSAFNGMAMENMTRGHGWLFLDIGRRLERALHLLTVLRAALKVDPAGQFLLEPMLEMADSVMTYRRSYYARPQLSGVLDLVLMDNTNPRSLAFQLGALAGHASDLPATSESPAPGRPQKLLKQAIRRLRSGDLRSASKAKQVKASPELDAWLEGLLTDLRAASDALTLHYFTHAEAS